MLPKYEHLIPEHVRAKPLTAEEIQLRIAFVLEYMKDYSKEKAALRCGFDSRHAKREGEALYTCGYTQRLLWETEGKDLEEQDVKDVANRTMRRMVKASMYNENQVMALAHLTKLLAMETDLKNKVLDNRSCVMVVPAMQSVDDWSASAQASQEKLKQEVRE